MNGLSPSKYVPSSPICTEPFSNHYNVLEDIGRGKFAVVRKCQNILTEEMVAAKVIRKRRKGKSCREEILREVVMLELAMAHPRLVSLREVFETQSELILVTEFCAGGELFHECVINESFKEDDVRKLLVQILEGLAYLHDNNIVHLDLKPQNILLTKPFPEGEVKICDLGFACLTNTDEDIRDIIGTPDYVAPEVLDYEPLNIQTDMWSLGVLTYVMLTTYSPFAGDTQQETFCNITQVKVDYPDDIFGDINELAIDFISKLLIKNPRQRLTAKQCLEHPWLKDITTSLSIKVPTPDHSADLANSMVTPSNWHLTPNRRASLDNSCSITLCGEGASELDISEKTTAGEEKDGISKTLSDIDIDRSENDALSPQSSRSSSHSFNTCVESISENQVPKIHQLESSLAEQSENSLPRESSVSSPTDSITSTETSTTCIEEQTLSNFALNVVDDVLVGISHHKQSVKSTTGAETNHGEPSDSKRQGQTDKTKPLAMRLSKQFSSSHSSQNSNPNEKSKRFSMEIPLKKAKCVEDEADKKCEIYVDGELHPTNSEEEKVEDIRNAV